MVDPASLDRCTAVYSRCLPLAIPAPQEQEPAQLASQPGDHAQALAASIHGTLEGLESGFQQLCTSLQERVQAAQQQTLDHLLLYESAVDELQASGGAGSGRGLPVGRAATHFILCVTAWVDGRVVKF